MHRHQQYIFFLLLLICSVGCSHYSEEINQKLHAATLLMEQNPDSSLKILQGIEEVENLGRQQQAEYALLLIQARDKNLLPLNDTLIQRVFDYYKNDKNIEKKVKAYFYLGRMYEEAKDNEQSMKAYLNAETYAQPLDNPALKGLISYWMGNLLLQQHLYDNAAERYRQSITHFKTGGQFKNEGAAEQRLGYSFLYLQKYDSSVVHFDRAHILAEQTNDTLMAASAFFLMGESSFWNGDYALAKQYLNRSITLNDKDTRRLSYFCGFMSDIYYYFGQSDSSAYYVNKSVEWAQSSGDGPAMREAYLRVYSRSKADKRFTEAFSAIENYIVVNDSLTNEANRHNVLETEKKYRNDLLLVENQKLELQRRIYSFIAGILFLSLLSATLIFLLYRSRQQKRWLELKEKESRERQKLLESEIALVEASNRILKLNEFVLKRLDVSKELIAMGRSLSGGDAEKTLQKLQDIIARLTFDAKDREELKRNINEAFDGFVDRLVEGFPKLTEHDIQLCCLIRAGFENDIIISILNITYETLYSTRYRLREKMDLVNKNVRLAPFLSSI